MIPIKFKWKTFAIIAITGGLLTGCQSPSPEVKSPPLLSGEAGLQQIVEYSTDQTIIPNIKQWRNQAAQLVKQSKRFCAQPEPAGLQATQQQFKQLYRAWNRVLPFDFGPLRDNLFTPKVHFIESTRQRGRDYSNPIKAHIQQVVDGGQTLDAAYFDGLKFTLVGMPALEIMLFDAPSRALLAQYQSSPRQCALLEGLSALNLRHADYVLQGWTGSNQDQPNYRQLFLNNQSDDGEKSIVKLIFAMQDYLRYVHQRKLPNQLDATRSGMSYENLAAGLQAVSTLFSQNGAGISMAAYLKQQGKADVADTFMDWIHQSESAIQQQDMGDLARLYGRMIRALERDIPQAMGVDLGINFTDGD